MDFCILEARRYTSGYYKSIKRRVKDYEIDLESGNDRIYNCGDIKERKLYRGDVLIRRPHDCVFSDGAQDTYILTLDFSSSVPPEIYSRNVTGPFQNVCREDCITRLEPIIHPKDTSAFIQLYKHLITLPDKNSAAARELVREIIYSLNAEIAHGNYESLKPPEGPCEAVISYMQKNLGKPITLDFLAELAHLEKSYLVRTFRRVTGKTPIEMLIGFRMDRASDLVINTNLKIGDISALCGYRVTSFFISEYKKRFSMTPSEHRKAVNKN